MDRFNIYYGFAFLCLICGLRAYISPNIELEQKIAQVKNLSDWCAIFNIDGCDKEMETVDASGEKMAVAGETIAPALFDACNPRELTVMIPAHPDPDVIVFPTCTRAMRCGGCCTSAAFSCEPTEFTETYRTVFDSRPDYVGAQRFGRVTQRVVKIEEHVKCAPQCTTKAEHCNKLQTYEPSRCQCRCRPELLATKSKCVMPLVWDDTECGCVCHNRKEVTCPEPSHFSTSSCKCTLKTTVSGEIDLEKLLQQLNNGNIKLEGGNASSHESVNSSSEQTGGTVAVGGNGTGVAGQVESQPEVGVDKDTNVEISAGAEKVVEETTVVSPAEGTGQDNDKHTTAATTPTTTTTSTTVTTTTKKPCADTKCFGTWRPKLLPGGKCLCFPPPPPG